MAKNKNMVSTDKICYFLGWIFKFDDKEIEGSWGRLELKGIKNKYWGG